MRGHEQPALPQSGGMIVVIVLSTMRSHGHHTLKLTMMVTATILLEALSIQVMIQMLLVAILIIVMSIQLISSEQIFTAKNKLTVTMAMVMLMRMLALSV